MKKILSVLLMLLLAISMSGLALADDDNSTTDDTDADDETDDEDESDEDEGDAEDETDDEDEIDEEDDDEETEDETEEMEFEHGAEVRLLQLEKAIARNILRGQEVIDNAGEEADTTELESILVEMEALKIEVQNADPEAEDAVQTFVSLKHDARELSKKFRDVARTQIHEAKRAEIKAKIEAKKAEREEKLKEVKERLHAKLKAFNSKRLLATANQLGIGDGELLEKIKSGEITAKEAHEQLRTKFQEMTPEERKQLYSDLKEARVKKEVEAKVRYQNLKAKAVENQQTRLQARLGQLDAKELKIADYAEKRLAAVQVNRDKINAKMAALNGGEQ